MSELNPPPQPSAPPWLAALSPPPVLLLLLAQLARSPALPMAPPVPPAQLPGQRSTKAGDTVCTVPLGNDCHFLAMLASGLRTIQ